MKNNITKTDNKEILSLNAGALACLHKMFGFDFEKPYGAFKITGSFTFPQIRKFISNSYNINEVCAALYITTNKGGFYFSDYLYIIEVTPENIDISRRPCHFDFWDRRTSRSTRLISEPHIKGAVEDMRKDESVEAYLYIQNNIYRSEPTKKPYRTAEPSEHFDKSGCNVYEKREELKRLARMRAAQKAKEAFNAYDAEDDLLTSKRAIISLKQKLEKIFFNAITAEDVRKFADLVAHFGGLADTMCSLDYLTQRAANKAFSSLDQYNRTLNNLTDKINNLTDAVDGFYAEKKEA